MYTFLLIVLILDALVLVAAILMQAGKGSGLAANFGGASSTASSVRAIGMRRRNELGGCSTICPARACACAASDAIAALSGRFGQ